MRPLIRECLRMDRRAGDLTPTRRRSDVNGDIQSVGVTFFKRKKYVVFSESILVSCRRPLVNAVCYLIARQSDVVELDVDCRSRLATLTNIETSHTLQASA